MRVRFKQNYSDEIGTFRKGWENVVPDALGKRLIDGEIAEEVKAQTGSTVANPQSDQPAAAQSAKPLTAKERKAAEKAAKAAAEAAAKPADKLPDAPPLDTQNA